MFTSKRLLISLLGKSPPPANLQGQPPISNLQQSSTVDRSSFTALQQLMADGSSVKRHLGDGVSEADPENGSSEIKKPRLEENPAAAPGHSHGEEGEEEASETQEPRDPGKKQ